MGVRAGQGFGARKPKRGKCPECGKQGMTMFKPLGGTGYLGRHCQYCAHSESVSPAEYMRLRAVRIAAADLAPGGRVKVRSDAVHPEDGIPHRHRGVMGTLRKPLPGKPEEWLVALDNRGPICLHVANIERCAPGE